MKSVIDSIYRKQLGDKTLRGLQGRALAGFATGGVAYGYALRKQVDALGKSIGSPTSPQFRQWIDLGLHRYRNIEHKFVLEVFDEQVGRAAVQLRAQDLRAVREVHES